jgi:ABC-type Fe3+-hydroxamate transport system substrate-binding protein
LHAEDFNLCNMPVFIDQLGKRIELNKLPQRIVSLVPSQTELLFDLGLEKEVVGITKFCVHPGEWFKQKQRIGGTKTISIEKIKALQPELIIANKEENVQAQVEEIADFFPVWTSDINTLEDALQMITAVGALTGKQEKAAVIVTDIQTKFARLNTELQVTRRRSAAYLIWKEPYMAAGGDTFISAMLFNAGFFNSFQQDKRYPEISIEEIQTSGCEVLLLSSEPFPFREKHVLELQQQLPNVKIHLVDGEMFSWYGSRLLLAPGYFKTLQQQLAANL